jgi:ubiquitin-conjugating enzyme E2 W
MSSIASRRLAKELRDLHANGCPVGIELLEADEKWIMGIEVLGDTLYAVCLYSSLFIFIPAA